MTDKDKPVISATLKDLDKEVRPGPFVYATAAGKRVTFPDPGELGWQATDEFTRDLTGDMPGKTFLIKYLDEKDYKALVDEDLNGYQMRDLMTLMVKHYEAFFGTPGEGPASRD